MGATGRDLNEAYLRGFFEPGEVREVLGMRLVNDPERAERVFPEYRAGRRPRVFLKGPGPFAEARDSVFGAEATEPETKVGTGSVFRGGFLEIVPPGVATAIPGGCAIHS
jgi:hypothetical protein